jgi:TonB dependent receptor-like, beta-barrel
VDFGSLQSFLEGTPTGGSIIAGNPDERLRERWYAGFVQDTWRVTPRLTLTPGLRYEYIGSPHEKNNYLGVFDNTAPGGIVQVGPGLPHSSLINVEKTDFSPRIGVAWDIFGNGKTVLRAAASRLSSFPTITSVSEQSPFGANIIDGSGAFIVDQRGTAINQNFPQTLSFDPGQLTWNTTGPVFPITSAVGPSCTPAVPCAIGAVDPNIKQPKSVQWNLDIQRAITSGLTLDVAYVGNHGYAETHSIDLNAVPVGTGWDQTTINKCLASAPNYKSCKVNRSAIAAAQPYATQFPWFNYIVRTTSSGFSSNYNGLQVTADQRSFHGLSFLAAYTYSHSLDYWSKNSQNSQILADPSNPRAQYGNSDQDIRHRFRFSPTWMIPGKKSPAQMLEGWSISGVLALQTGLPWSPVDNNSKTDFVGTGENKNIFVARPNNGMQQYWNYSGPRSAFTSSQDVISCYNGVSGNVPGCDPLASAPAAIQSGCTAAAQAPYAGNAQLMQLAVASLADFACYTRNGGFLTPPAYGTNGNAGRNLFLGPSFRNVDLSIAKSWHIGERYSAQFRAEFFNIFNHPTIDLPGSLDPNKGVTGQFGYANQTPDSGNAVFGTGGPRHIQFGLKLAF